MEKQKVLVELKQVCKSFDGKSVLNNLDLQIYNGEFLTILGPSGCGKTTTLRLIAGFEHADSGDIILDGKKINNIPANNREVHTVFQNYALFPHMTVFENIAFGLKMHKVPKNEIKDKVMEVLRIVKLEEFVDRKPHQLSGGQQQRVAIARALYANPAILLADEPTASLDTQNVEEVGKLFKKLAKEREKAILIVTHDPRLEKYADHIYEMMDGKMSQKK